MISLPLVCPEQPALLAFDLYFTKARPELAVLEQPTRGEICAAILAVLLSTQRPDPTSTHHVASGLAELSGPDSQTRMNVWTAVGMVMAVTHFGQRKGLVILRGYAFSHDLGIDEVAQRLTDQPLSMNHVLSSDP